MSSSLMTRTAIFMDTVQLRFLADVVDAINGADADVNLAVLGKKYNCYIMYLDGKVSIRNDDLPPAFLPDGMVLMLTPGLLKGSWHLSEQPESSFQVLFRPDLCYNPISVR